MTVRPLATVDLSLQPQLQWLWFSATTNAFVTGDENAAYSVPIANPSGPTPLDAGTGSTKSACNLPIPDALKDEFLSQCWHGLRFLSRAAYDGIDADILRTLVFGPDYNVPLLHSSSGAVLALKSSSMQLLSEGDGLKPLDKTKPRGKSALAFAAHPTEPLLVYGDNAGTFTAHRFAPTKFGKAAKIADKQRKASRIEFLSDGTKLLVGGMGYFATFAFDGKSFTPLHEVSVPVRDFVVGTDGQTIVVNQGMHGLSVYACDKMGTLTKQAEAQPAEPVQFAAVSADLKHIAVTHQSAARLTVYSV